MLRCTQALRKLNTLRKLLVHATGMQHVLFADAAEVHRFCDPVCTTARCRTSASINKVVIQSQVLIPSASATTALAMPITRTVNNPANKDSSVDTWER